MSALPASGGESLSAEAIRRIDRETAKYPQAQKRSAVVAALAIAQHEIGWLPAWAIEAVARHLAIAPVAAYEVASFYSLFQLQPGGRHKLRLCTNLPCALSGANEAAAHLKEKLGVEFGETSADGAFTLHEGECFGACGDAPVLLVDNKRMCSRMNREKLDELLDELRRQAQKAGGA